MTLGNVKGKFNEGKDKADLERSQNTSPGIAFEIDEAFMAEMDRRQQNFISGSSKGYTIEESLKKMKENRQQK